MCLHCNYAEMLSDAGLSATEHRLRILEVVGNNSHPLSAADIFETLRRSCSINRVTVYRILETLVEKKVVERLSGGGRSFFYGLAPNDRHDPHPHFYCRQCGRMDCLHPESIAMDLAGFRRIFPGRIQHVEVRVDGLCQGCLRSARNARTETNEAHSE